MRRRRTVLSLAVTLLAAALSVPLAGPAYASTCGAVAVPPHVILGQNDIHAIGSFHCADASTGMTVTVCIEEAQGGLLGLDGWYQDGCATTVADQSTDTVTAKVAVRMMVYSTYLRTTVTAVNDNGDTAAAKSPPVFWFNCACYVG